MVPVAGPTPARLPVPEPLLHVASVLWRCACVLCSRAQDRIADYRSLFLHGGVAQGVARLDGHFLDCNYMFTKLTGCVHVAPSSLPHPPVSCVPT